jgi:hypothetical protein
MNGPVRKVFWETDPGAIAAAKMPMALPIIVIVPVDPLLTAGDA